MTPGNFDWFLHAMLFYHTKNVLKKVSQKQDKREENEAADIDDDAIEDNN
jgi:hypothetical protein